MMCNPKGEFHLTAIVNQLAAELVENQMDPHLGDLLSGKGRIPLTGKIGVNLFNSVFSNAMAAGAAGQDFHFKDAAAQMIGITFTEEVIAHTSFDPYKVEERLHQAEVLAAARSHNTVKPLPQKSGQLTPITSDSKIRTFSQAPHSAAAQICQS